VNLAAKGDVFLLTEEQRAELKAINRQWLLSAPSEPAQESRSVTLERQ